MKKRHFAWILCLVVAVLSAGVVGEVTIKCDAESSTLCIVTSLQTFDDGSVIKYSGNSLRMESGSGFICGTECTIHLSLSNNFSISNDSKILMSSIDIVAMNNVIEYGSLISSKGKSLSSETRGTSTNTEFGAGYGGDGASCTTEGTNAPSRGGPSYDWTKFMQPTASGSAAKGTGGGKGGGFIHISASDNLLIDGIVDASGTTGDAKSGGGSGGSINIVTVSLTGSGSLWANGGDGLSGGGGGRIGFQYNTVQSAQNIVASVSGGASSGCDIAGGAGTVWQNNLAGFRRLWVDNSQPANSQAAFTPFMSDTGTFTEVPDFISISGQSNVVVNAIDSKPAVVTAVMQVFVISSILSPGVQSEEFSPKDDASVDLMIKISGNSSLGVSVSGTQSSLQADGTITVDAGDGQVYIDEHVSVSAGSFHVRGDSFQMDGAVTCAHEADIRTLSSIGLTNTLKGSQIYLQTESLEVGGGRVESTGSNCSSEYGPILTCSLTVDEAFDAGVSVVVHVSDTVSLSYSSSFFAGTQQFCIDGQLLIESGSYISSTAGGCEGGNGVGVGHPKSGSGVAGGGAGHGGVGGQSADGSKSGVVYDLSQLPTMTGSGGGNPGGVGGAGGGLVWIESRYILLNGDINSKGGSGSTSPEGPGGGGGSGGTIFINTALIDGSGSFNAYGGVGGSKGGGGGGGGMVHFYWFPGVYAPWVAVNYTGAVVIYGGKGSSKGQDGASGTVSGESCPAGYEDCFCRPCKVGYFKDTVGQGACSPCTNKPIAGKYDKVGETTPNCHYVCDNGLIYPHCYTPFYHFVELVGGPLGLLGCILGLVFAALAPYAYKRWKEQKRPKAKEIAGFSDSLLHNDQEAPQYTSAIHHIVQSSTLTEQDLGRHLHRTYFHGRNTPISPWYMDSSPPYFMVQDVRLDSYATFVEWCNHFCSWTRTELVIYLLLSLFLLPYATKWLNRKRDEKYQRLRYFVQIEYDYAFLRSFRARAMLNCLRFNATSDLTLAYIDILEYSETEERGGKPTLPMVILCAGNGTYREPWWIDPVDPLVACVGDYTYEYRRSWLCFITALNARLRTVHKSCIDATMNSVMELLQFHNEKRFNLAPMRFRLDFGKFQFTGSGEFQLGLAVTEAFEPGGLPYNGLADASINAEADPDHIPSTHGWPLHGSLTPAEAPPGSNDNTSQQKEWPISQQGYGSISGHNSEQETGKRIKIMDNYSAATANVTFGSGSHHHGVMLQSLAQIPYSGNLLETKVMKGGFFTVERVLMWPKLLFHRIWHALSLNLRRRGTAPVWGTLSVLDLIAELFLIVFTLYAFSAVDITGFVCIITILPLYIFVVPVLGVAAVINPRWNDLPRIFVYTNAISTINSTVAIIYALIIWETIEYSNWWIYTPLLLFVNKWVLAFLMNSYLASIEVSSVKFYQSDFDAFVVNDADEEKLDGIDEDNEQSNEKYDSYLSSNRDKRVDSDINKATYGGDLMPFNRPNISGFAAAEAVQERDTAPDTVFRQGTREFEPPPSSQALLGHESPPAENLL